MGASQAVMTHGPAAGVPAAKLYNHELCPLGHPDNHNAS
jgi:hypothetical protein